MLGTRRVDRSQRRHEGENVSRNKEVGGPMWYGSGGCAGRQAVPAAHSTGNHQLWREAMR